MIKILAQSKAPVWNGLEINSKVQYGIIPTSDSVVQPVYIFQNSASTGFAWKGLNFGITYSYNNPNALIGIRNGFTFQFIPTFKAIDTEALQSSLSNGIHSKLDSLNTLTSNYQKRIQFLESYNGDSIQMPKWNLIDTSQLNMNSVLPDSLNLSNPLDTLSSNGQDINAAERLSVSEELSRCRKELDNLKSLQEKYTAQLEGLKDKKESLFSNPFSKSLPMQLRKLDVGNFTASTSPISLWGTSLFGVSVALNKGSYYIDAGIGKIQTPIFPELNQLGLSKQMIDAVSAWGRNMSSSTRVLSWIVLGKGRPEQSHFYIQGLTGRGKRDLSDTQSGNAVNYVLEAQGQWVNGGSKLEINASKSFLSRPLNLMSDAITSKGKYDVGYAFHIGWNQRVERTNTEIALKSNLYTATFNSFGITVPRHDYLQSQIQLKQGIGKKANFTIQAKYDQRGLNQKVCDFKSLNSSLRLKVFKRGNLILLASQNKGVIQIDTSSVTVNQTLLSGIFNMPLKLGKLIPIVSAQQVIAVTTNIGGLNRIENSNVSVSITKKSFSSRVGLLGVKQTSSDSLVQESYFVEGNFGITKPKWNTSITLRQNVQDAKSYGLSVNVGLAFSNLKIMVMAEKFVYDPISMPWLSLELAKKHPFRGSIQVTYTLKKSK